MPLPFPGVPPVTVMNAEFEAAVQAHPAWVVTLTVPAPPAAGDVADGGEIEYVQDCWAVVVQVLLRAVPGVGAHVAQTRSVKFAST